MATKIVAQPLGGGEPIAELQADILTYGFRANRPGNLLATLALDAVGATRDVLDPGASELAVVRNDATVWVGPLLTVEEDWEKRLLKLGAEGLMGYTRRWHETTTVVHTATDQATIAKQLVDRHQAKAGGDFGLDTTAVGTTGVTRDRTYWSYERKNVYDALVQLTELENGFDLEFRPSDRKMIAHYPSRGRRLSETVLDERNIRQFHRSLDATRQASQVLAIGAGEGEDMLTHDAQDSSAVSVYGLTQDVLTNKDVSVTATLQGHAAYRLAVVRGVPNIISVTCGTSDPNPFTIVPGDELKLVWASTYDPVDEFQRVVGMDIHFEQGAEERVTYHLEAL